MLVPLLVAALQVPTAAVDSRASEHLRYGAAGYGNPGTTLVLREGFACLHDSARKSPLWVSHRLNRAYAAKNVERASSSAWKADPLLPFGYRAELTDYRYTGWERGHLAPAEDMRRSRNVQLDSFLLSNSVPQNSSNNSGAWNSLEAIVRAYASTGDLIVISGPVYSRAFADGTLQVSLTKPQGIPVPSWLFKVVVRESGQGDPQILAFLVENRPLPGFQPTRHLVSVRDVERYTGLNFLNALPTKVQDRIEKTAASELWAR
ncbi:MAG TPA: DNA/RNA non-specific endonuclease [Fimbriimonas sp.]